MKRVSGVVMTEVQVVFAFAACAFLIVVGVACLFRTSAVRDYAVKTANPRFNPFYAFMKSNQYVWHLRICGFVALAMAAIITFSLFSRLR